MTRQVTAFRSERGQLFETRADAVADDLSTFLAQVGDCVPVVADRIADTLVTNAAARVELIRILEQLK